MAVKIRMSRIGRRHRPFFRINAIDSRQPRDGKVLEKLGHYDPIEKDPEKQIVLDMQRVQYWLDKGAIPSDAVSYVLLQKGIETASLKQKTNRRAKARAAARAKGKPFTRADRIAAEKQLKQAEEEAKAEAEAKAKVEAQEQKVEAKAESTPQTESETSEPETAEESAAPEPKAKKEKKSAPGKKADDNDEN